MYQISYKGKAIGETMDQNMAEAMLQQLSPCFNNLELVEVKSSVPILNETKRQASA